MNAIVHIKLNLIISTIVGLLVALFFIFLPNIASILPARISNTLNNIYNLKSWSQLIPLYIVIFFVGLAKNISSLYSNNKMILLILLLLDIVQIMLFLFLFLDTPFFNKNYLYISKSSQFIFIFAFSIVFGFEIIGDLIRLL
ncbi:MAG: hypothetical protein SPF04_00595 [Bacilli bacterium]|uniref:Uncharacterized protein n=1 Tax=Lactobacillus johnsonii TaxID=33959 RepID=A0A9W3SN91_LACJH|nr:MULTISPECIES: hypothetical protein [Lactobacillus]MCI6693669.1 hypothetical protein [Clostridium sp.]MCI7187989.1 hypothetical protein [Fusobacterium mortiferum]MDY5057966.1 hypothetical protein [Bacilli bacterium]AOG27177.1 hypothetical protein BBP16_10100 [Lactobacillus johnsonii]MCI6763155.1 hypothetical protein [Lactobacillus johnsonii]